MNLVAIQMVSNDDINDNFSQLETQLADCMAQGKLQLEGQATLVVLPENFALLGEHDSPSLRHQEDLGSEGLIQSKLAAVAQKYHIWLAGGTLPTTSKHADKRYATLTVFNPQGQLVADYQKIHLFDVDVNDAMQAYRESQYTQAGNNIVVVDVAGVKVGLTVCYDMRFPSLFQALAQRGAQIILVPSAFTQPTGQAHWHTLLRARAIENQVYIVAPAQGGIHNNGRQTYGHSLIADPWGKIIAQIEQGVGWIQGQYDPTYVAQLRQRMPIQTHNRFINELKP